MKPSRRDLLTAAGGMAAIGGAFSLGMKFGAAPAPSFHRITFRRGLVHRGCFVPGSSEIVYDAEWEGGPPRIFAAGTDGTESRRLDLPPARLMSVSRSGELALRLEEGSALARVPFRGGTPAEVLHNILWADWGPDASSFLVARQVRSRYRIDFPIGRARYETAASIEYPRVSPDGRSIAFFESTADGALVNVVDSGGARRTLSARWRKPAGLVWRGTEIWFSAAQGTDAPAIHAATLDGAVRPVFRLPIGACIGDAGPGGRVLFSGWSERAAMMCQPPEAEAARDLSWLDDSVSCDISADGVVVLFTEMHSAPAAYLRRSDGSPAVKLCAGRALALSPDAQWAAAVEPGALRQLAIVSTAHGPSRTLQAENFTYAGARWFPDGARLLVWGNHPERLRRHFVQDAAGGPIRAITPEGAAPEAAISPDGEYVAAHSGPGIFLFPTDGGEPQPARGNTAGAVPAAWSGDARSLYVRRGFLVELLDLKTGKSEIWKDLTPPDAGGVDGIESLSIAPDGRAYVYSFRRSESELYLAEGL